MSPHARHFVYFAARQSQFRSLYRGESCVDLAVNGALARRTKI